MSTLDDFFGPAYDEKENEAKCLYCNTSSKQGGGKWVGSGNLWVCSNHMAQHNQDEANSQNETAARLEKEQQEQDWFLSHPSA